jgi:uncharacterized protein involved in exopolysaccharide biosynthesis
MLQTNKTNTSIAPNSKPPEPRSLIETVAEGLRFIRRHLTILFLSCFAATGAALVYLIVAAPTYVARAELVIDTKGAPGDAASVSTIVGSQIAIITSESVARSVITKLGLAEDPEFAGREGTLRGVIRSLSRLIGERGSESEPSPMQYAVEAFDRKLSAKRIGFTYIVEITFESRAPERAAQILNAVADTHIMASMDAKYKSALRSEKWVKERMNELSSRASAAQKAVADYHKNRSDVASADSAVPGTSPPQVTDLRELEAAAESATKAYDNFLRMLRYMDAMQQQSLPVFEARLLTEASRPFRPSWPKARIVVLVSIAGGFLLGVGIGVLRDVSDRGIRANEPASNDSGVISTHHSTEQRRVPHLEEGRRERSKTI